MRAGKLHRPVVYQTKTTTKGLYNEDVLGDWTDAASFYAEVRSPTGRETYLAEQMRAEVDHVLVCRYPGFDLSPAGRVVYRSRVFNVSAVLNVEERDRTIMVFCTENVLPSGE